MSEQFVEVYIKKFYTMTCVAFSLDGQQIATGSQNGRTYIWDTNTQERIKELHDYDSAVSHLTYSKNGRLLATGSVDEDKVCIWNMETEERIWLDSIESINSFAFSIDGKYIATGADRNLQIWDTSNGELLHSLEAGGNPLVAFSLTTVACSQDASIQLWDAVGGTILHDIRPAHKDLITAIAINDTTLMTVSDDGYIKLWNIELAVETLIFRTSYYNFTSVSFSPDGNSIATACSRRNNDDDDIVVPRPLIVLFDITQGKISDRIILPDRSDSIETLEYCQDGRLMGFGGMYSSETATATQVIIWDSFPVAPVAPVEPVADLYLDQDTGFNVGDDDGYDSPGAYQSQGFVPAESIRQILRSNLAGKKQKLHQTKNNKKQTKNHKKQTKNHKNNNNKNNKKQTKNHKKQTKNNKNKPRTKNKFKR
jgi:WD40 repeat protein